MKRAVLVEEEAAVEVAVPGEAHIRAADLRISVDGTGLRFSSSIGFGTPFGKVPSGLQWFSLDELERQARLEPVDDECPRRRCRR